MLRDLLSNAQPRSSAQESSAYTPFVASAVSHFRDSSADVGDDSARIVWHDAQPALFQTACPATGSPTSVSGVPVDVVVVVALVVPPPTVVFPPDVDPDPCDPYCAYRAVCRYQRPPLEEDVASD